MEDFSTTLKICKFQVKMALPFFLRRM